jgi:pimeloyl-ACP methyl ester carboxylesterase
VSHIRIDEHLVPVPGGSVFVRTWTPAQANASPLVLLHDSLGSVEQWRNFPGALAQSLGRRVLAYDRLGFGRSSARSELPSVDFIAEEARTCIPAIREALGLARYSLFGHSVGGAMALMIASQDSGCDFVITEAAQTFVEDRTLAGIRTARAQFQLPGQFDKLVRWHGAKARWVLEAWTGVWLSPAFATWSLESHLGQIECPVLAIHGDQDEYGSRAFPDSILRGVRGPSRLALLEQCGHIPHREQQDQVLKLVAGFISSLL